MKSVLLNDQGYTENGKWRLAPVEPDQPMIDAARDKYMAWHYACGNEDVPLYYTPSDHFRAMIAASPSPVLAEAVPVGYFQKHPVTGVWEETVGDGVLLYAAPPAPVMPADGYVQTGINSPFNACMYREGCKSQKERIAELEAENQGCGLMPSVIGSKTNPKPT